MTVATENSQIEEITRMLKYYIKATEALHRLRTDKNGVVSLEYVIVAACIIGVVSVAFGNTGLGKVLSDSFTSIGVAVGKVMP
jgi:pilus assembly protein Flp/PilA